MTKIGPVNRLRLNGVYQVVDGDVDGLRSEGIEGVLDSVFGFASDLLDIVFDFLAKFVQAMPDLATCLTR